MISGAQDKMKMQGPLFKNFQVGDSSSIQLSLGPFLRLCPAQLHKWQAHEEESFIWWGQRAVTLEPMRSGQSGLVMSDCLKV